VKWPEGGPIWSKLLSVVGAGTLIGLTLVNILEVERLSKRTRPTNEIAWTMPTSSPTAPKVLGAKTTPTPTVATKPVKKPVTKRVSSSPMYIGIFASISPSDPNYRKALDAIASLGCNLVYNYTALDGSPAEVTAYLDYAQSKGLKTIIGLQDLYDQLPDGADTASTYSQYGSSNEAIALTAVRDFQGHPGVWGFSLTDERPESPEDVAAWRPILAQRSSQIKQLTSKPLMSVLVGWSTPNQAARRQLFQSIGGISDVLAPDYYPIPFEPSSRISTLTSDAAAYKETWFIEQVFSWASYPDTIAGLGYSAAGSRLPTETEMLSMAQMALSSGSKNLLLYSYFDIKDNAVQLDRVRRVISSLKN
jgi:hypothetical protein